MGIVLILFWVAVAIIAYAYVLFPLLVFLRGRLLLRPYQSADITPRVSMIIAAHNEAERINAKLDNALSLDYPAESLQVIVASDGSDDGTNEIVRGYGHRDVKLLALPRIGKAQALNAAVFASSGEILNFSDADCIFAAEAMRALVRPFADTEVGGVSGNQKFLKQARGDLTGDGKKSHWNFDRALKRSQSKAGSAISATGAIYAIRRRLFQPIPDGVTDDFYTSTGVIAQGYRLVLVPDAVAYEPIESSASQEFERKVRVITRSLQAILLRRTLLNPFRFGFYSLQLFSHKVLRRLVVFPLLILLLVSPLLWSQGAIYDLAVLAQLVFYGLAFLALPLEGTPVGRMRIFDIPFYFCMVNLACLVAAMNILRGRRIESWEPKRQGDSGEYEPEADISSPQENGSP
jgi:cellulose synthase/poly-beta-1,6-N-acetylglucosamine synthase-like glycosyltransferase